jgi:hypothetical protein
MTSHEYARKLRAVADLLEGASEFKMPAYMDGYVKEYGADNIQFHRDKELFIAAVRALPNGRKAGDSNTYDFIVGDGLLHLQVNRSAVCRVVRPAVPAEYECEPLLSPEEEAQVGA